MRDQTDCHYPYVNLCLRDCESGCRARKTIWRKRQIEDQEAEDEEFERIATSNTCKYKTLCLDYPTHCPDCPSNYA